MREAPSSLPLGIAMLAAFALLFGGLRLLRGGERRKGVLMLVAAIVLIGNVAILTW